MSNGVCAYSYYKNKKNTHICTHTCIYNSFGVLLFMSISNPIIVGLSVSGHFKIARLVIAALKKNMFVHCSSAPYHSLSMHSVLALSVSLGNY